jgi:hypothetical protein
MKAKTKSNRRCTQMHADKNQNNRRESAYIGGFFGARAGNAEFFDPPMGISPCKRGPPLITNLSIN